MHEYSIVSALLDRVDAEARSRGASRVHKVRVRIGSLSGVEPTLFKTAYETFRNGSLCSGAELEVVPVEARWVCSACEGEVPLGEALVCRACGAPARLSGGDEIVLETIEMEVA